MVTVKRSHALNNNSNNTKHKLYPSPPPLTKPHHKLSLANRSRSATGLRAISTSSASEAITDEDISSAHGPNGKKLISIPAAEVGMNMKIKPLKIRLSMPSSSKNSVLVSPAMAAAIAVRQQSQQIAQQQQQHQSRPTASGSNVILQVQISDSELSSPSENEHLPLSASMRSQAGFQPLSPFAKSSPLKNRNKTNGGSPKALAALNTSLLSSQSARRPKLRSAAASAQSARPPIENFLRPDDSISHQGLSSGSDYDEDDDGNGEEDEDLTGEDEGYDDDDEDEDDMMTSEQEQSHRKRKVRRRQRKERAWRYSLFHDADSLDTIGLEYGDMLDSSCTGSSSDEEDNIMDKILADDSSDAESDLSLHSTKPQFRLEQTQSSVAATPSHEDIVAADLKGDIEDVDASELLFGENWSGDYFFQNNPEMGVEYEFKFGNESSEEEDLIAPARDPRSGTPMIESDQQDADDSDDQVWNSSDGETTEEDISFWTSASGLRNSKSSSDIHADPLLALTRAASDWGVSVQAAATMLSNVTSPAESTFHSASHSDTNAATALDTPRANTAFSSKSKKPIMGLFAPSQVEQACAFIDGSPAPIESPFRRLQSSGRGKRKRLAFSLEPLHNHADDNAYMSPLSSALPSPSLPSEPLNMKDLLDADLLDQEDVLESASDDEAFDDTAALRQIAGLNRWGKVPIGQFRRSRTSSSRLSPTVQMSSPSTRHMIRDPHARFQITSPSEHTEFNTSKNILKKDKKKAKKERIDDRDSKVFFSDLIAA